MYSNESRHVSGLAIGNGHQFHAAMRVETKRRMIICVTLFNAVKFVDGLTFLVFS